jgi:uncharacterized protein YraI
MVLLLAAGSTGTSQAQTTQGGIGCNQQPRLTVGAMARVTHYPDLPNRLRTQPGYTSEIIGQILPGGIFEVISGPTCIQGVYWWQVKHDGRIGWTAGGNGNQTYWLEPVTLPPTTQDCAPQPRLIAATEGRVLPGLPNVIRTHPGTVASGVMHSEVIGEIPGGAEFVVLDGPVCAPDGRFWWYVQYRNLIGWTAEGEDNTYWLEPVNSAIGTCEGALPSRLVAGQPGMIAPEPAIPNVLRTQPGIDTWRIGSIPAGAPVDIIKGPHCADGYAWYLVQYRHLSGWTAESGKGLYWLIPHGSHN